MPISPIHNNPPIFTNIDTVQNEEENFKNGVDAWANEVAPGEKRAEAAQRIKDAYSRKENSLDLSGLGLCTLPVQIGELTSLSKLCLYGNSIRDITALAGLINLSELNLSRSGIRDITPLSGLIKLLKLNLSLNWSTDIRALAGLINLSELYLSNNSIRDITPLAGLINLSVLDLSNSGIRDITPLSGLIKLLKLDLSVNWITDIRALAGLINLSELYLSMNWITDITSLSDLIQLLKLHLHANQITDIRALAGLINLEELYVSDNQLTSIPESFLRLPARCQTFLDNNRFSEVVLEQLRATANAANYRGPTIHFSMTGASDQGYTAQPLADVVASWYKDSAPDISSAFSEIVWEAIDDEPSAKSFSIFLQRLYNTVNSTQPTFIAKVLDWLKRLEGDQELRHEIFLEAKEGLGACEDRISLAFNAMKQRELTLNVERGHYDDKPDELIAQARQTFRFNELEKMAHDKVKRLRLVDAVEVYLAYLVKTQKELSLDLDTPEMRFFGVSGVTEGDIQAAILRVKQNENKLFLNYLANEWTPWPAVLKRLQPEAYKELNKTIYEAQEKALEKKQAAFVVDTAATGVSHLQSTKDESDQIAASHKCDFTQAFLQERGLGDLLNPVW